MKPIFNKHFRKSVWQKNHTVMRYLKYVWKKHPFITSGIALLTMLEAATPAAVAYINALLLDGILKASIENYPSISKIKLTSFSNIPQFLFLTIILYIFVLLVSNFISRINRVLKFDLQKYLEIEIEGDITSKVASLDAIHFDIPDTNDLINKVTTKSKSASLSSFNQSVNVLGILTSLVLYITILVTLNPLIILIVVVLAAPESLIYAKYSKKLLNVWNEMTEKRRDATTTSSYLYSDKFLKEIKIFNSVRYFIDRHSKLMKESITPQIHVNHKRTSIDLIFSVFSTLGYAYIILLLITDVIVQKITVGTFTFYINAINRLQDNLKNLFASFARMYEDSEHTKYLFQLMDLKNNIESGVEKIDDGSIPPFIKFEDVSFCYPGTDNFVVKNLNLEINSGEKIAIVGDNGAGKTTLLKLLFRFYDVTSGKILINGIDIKKLDLDHWYDMLGAVFQDFNFYHFDAKTNIGLGNLKKINDMDAIKSAANMAGADEFINSYKTKYDQVLKKSFSNGVDPSVGQQQRIAIARVFLSDSPIIILDEPTSSVDPETESEIFKRLFEHSKNKTVIIVSHRYSTVKKADKIIVMDQGSISEKGSHEDLMKIPNGKYKSVYELQKSSYR